MRAYIIRRLLLIIPTFFICTLILFFLIRAVPGNVIERMFMENIGQSGGSYDMEQSMQEIRHMLGLDVPVHVQYVRWMGNIILHGDLGNSLWTGLPVSEQLACRIPVSFELGFIAIILAQIISIPIGVYSAIRQDTAGDYITRSIAIFCICVPSFWLGTLVMVYPSIWWRWTPPMDFISFIDNPLANLRLFVIPASILGMVMSGGTTRMMRTMMLEVLRQDYIRTAWSKGLRERLIVLRHAMRNALIPVVTLVGMQVPIMIAGSVVIEQIFCLPGVGQLIIETINRRDYIVLSGINLFIVCVVLVNNLVIDLTYAYLDPRIRYK